MVLSFVLTEEYVESSDTPQRNPSLKEKSTTTWKLVQRFMMQRATNCAVSSRRHDTRETIVKVRNFQRVNGGEE